MIKRHCIVCLKKLKREIRHGKDDINHCPSDAIYLSSVGNYGSSVYDMGEFYKDRIEGYICDECLKERAEFFNFVRNDGKVITFNKVLEDSRKTRRGFVRDIAKKLLNVGDEVAFIMPGRLYLRVGKIVDFTKTMAKIEYEVDGETDIINRPSSQIAKI